MGYYVKGLPNKKSNPKWRVIYISYKKEDTQESNAKVPKKEWHIPKDRWSSLGFHLSMNADEAKARSRQLNAQIHLKRQEERIKKIADEQAKTQKRYDAVLPEEFVSEFEARFVRKRDSQTDKGQRKKSRVYTTWRAAQRMITALGTEPSEWFYNTNEVYDYFYNQKISIKYLHSILKVANLWGFFICKKMGRPFLPVPFPRGYERGRIIQAHYEKDNVKRPSKPLKPDYLQELKPKINKANFNWLFLSVWFGLRPQEIDNLHDFKLWRGEVLPNGNKVLWVFQTKIVNRPPEDRWKPIPILFDEQHFALRVLEGGLFKRPIIKTMHLHFGRGITLYGGRKGFVDLMLSKECKLENISTWMGHSTVNRTWYSYKERTEFHVSGF